MNRQKVKIVEVDRRKVIIKTTEEINEIDKDRQHAKSQSQKLVF